MPETNWKEKRRVWEERAAEAARAGKGETALVYGALAEVVDGWSDSLRRIEALEQTVHEVESMAGELKQSVHGLTRKVFDLESRVHEDIEG